MTLVNLNNRPTHTIDSLIDTWFNGFPANLENRQGIPGSPASNIYSTKEAFHIELNVPGRSKEDLKVNIEKGLLTVSADKLEDKGDERKALRREFSLPAFKRSFTLNDTIDTEKIEAKYENGLLKFVLPRKEEAKPEVRQISIQ